MHKFHLNHLFPTEAIVINDITLLQVGVMHCNENDFVSTHLHDYLWELTVAIDGEGFVSVNEKEEKIAKNDIHLSCPFESHAIRSSENNPLKFLFIAFRSSDKNIEKELIKIQELFKISSRLIRNAGIQSQIELVIEEINKSNEILHDQLLYSILKQIIIMTIRSYNNAVPSIKKINKEDEFCYTIMSYINTHIAEIESLMNLSEIFNYNYFYISKIFKKTTGQTLSDYYRSRRLDAARTLLEQGYSCTEVANTLKFSSVYSFSKSFKQVFGIPPLKYKKNIKE